MADYYPATELEPSPRDLMALLYNSSPSDWIFDEATKIFTSKEDLLVFLVPDSSGGYDLKYGHLKVCSVENVDLEAFEAGATRTERLQLDEDFIEALDSVDAQPSSTSQFYSTVHFIPKVA